MPLFPFIVSAEKHSGIGIYTKKCYVTKSSLNEGGVRLHLLSINFGGGLSIQLLFSHSQFVTSPSAHKPPFFMFQKIGLKKIIIRGSVVSQSVY